MAVNWAARNGQPCGHDNQRNQGARPGAEEGGHQFGHGVGSGFTNFSGQKERQNHESAGAAADPPEGWRSDLPGQPGHAHGGGTADAGCDDGYARVHDAGPAGIDEEGGRRAVLAGVEQADADEEPARTGRTESFMCSCRQGMKDRRGQQSQLLVFHDVGRHEVNRSVERTNPDALLQEALLEAFHIDGMVQLHHCRWRPACAHRLHQAARGRGPVRRTGPVLCAGFFPAMGRKAADLRWRRPRHRPEDCP